MGGGGREGGKGEGAGRGPDIMWWEINYVQSDVMGR